MITRISGFGVFGPKMAVSWRTSVFQKMLCWNPYFDSVFWVRAFWAKLPKKGNFGHPPKKKKMIVNWKAHLWQFLCFFVFCCFWGVCFCFVSSGHLTWPLNPPYLFLFVLFFSFVCISFKKHFFPQSGFFCLFLSVSLCFSWAFFGLPLVQFLFLCLFLSLSLSLSLVLFFLSSFSPFFFAFFWLLLFVSLFVFFCFLSSLLLINEKQQHQNILLQSLFAINSFSFSRVLCLVSLSNPFFLSLFFPDFKLCFLFNMYVFGFQNKQFKTQFFGQEGGCNKRFFFVFCKMWKVIVFWGGFFCCKFW